MRTSKDPLMKLVSDIAGGAGDLGGRVRRGFGGFTGAKPGPSRPDGAGHGDGDGDTDGNPPRDQA